ncbi:MAG: DUF490 domain-containing protein, partial [Acidovorax sp.]
MRTSPRATRPPSPDFSAGASPPQRPPRRRRALRALGWLLAALIVLLVAAATAAWWWAGGQTSLATALARAAQHLPAGQQLDSRDVSGSLRDGGRIGWLRWSSPALVVEAHDITLGWQLAPLLRQRLELGEVHAARVRITPLDAAPSTGPAMPPTQLALPLQVGVPFRVDEIVWAGAPAVQAQGLAGDYRFDGQVHRLNITRLALAQGRYTARATLQAQPPLALDATLDGALDAAVPGGGASLPLSAQATLQGTLATAAARLQLQARVHAGDAAMQSDVQATLAPWAPQPLEAASAALRAVNLAALWPQAPATRLHGTVQAGPDGTGWALQANLRNELAGPWDKNRLPLTTLQAQARYDGARWTVHQAQAATNSGAATLQGSYTPATGALQGQADLRNLQPGSLHTALAAAPLAGRIHARTQGDAVRFDADIRAVAAPTRNAPLRINAFMAQGQWQPAHRTVRLERLLLDALQARAEASDVNVALADGAVQGRVALSVPGATARAQGSAAPEAGAGDLQVQWADAAATQRWLTGLPWVGRAAQDALQGAAATGSAQLSARWKGGWQALAHQLKTASAGKNAFELQATLNTPQLDLALPAPQAGGNRGTALQLRALKAELSGTAQQAALSLDGELRLNAGQPQQMQRLALQTRVGGGLAGAGQWQAQIRELRLQAHDAQRPGPWTLQLAEPVSVTARRSSAEAITVQASAGQARLTGPAPGTVALRWQPVRVVTGPALQVQTQGSLTGLPMAWVDALGIGGTQGQPLLARMGLATSIVLDGQWNVDTASTPARASASLRRASGDLRILAGDPTAVTAVQSSGQGVGAGATAPIATEASASPSLAGAPAGVRQAEAALELEGEALRARLAWASERAGEIDASASTRLALAGRSLSGAAWPADAPLAGSLRA